MKKAFSLVELLISLIIISVSVAAFIPIITKKMQNVRVAISSVDKISQNCDDIDPMCKLCLGKQCINCEKICPIAQFAQAATCTCKNCIEGCSVCVNDTSCSVCKSGYFLNSSICQKCSLGCASCTTQTSCSACEDGYILSDNNCVKASDVPCTKYGNICIANFNAGDDKGLPLPGGIKIIGVVSSGASGTELRTPVCWKGQTGGPGCNSDYSTYSGCFRTVCNFYAADQICKYHGWRLPTEYELG